MPKYYTEFVCPYCRDTWLLSMSRYSDRANKLLKAEFDAHVFRCENDELLQEILGAIERVSHANHKK